MPQNENRYEDQLVVCHFGARDWVSSADPKTLARGVPKNPPAPKGAGFLHLSASASELASLPNAKTPDYRRGLLCPGLDSNQHTLRRCYLKTVRLPISP